MTVGTQLQQAIASSESVAASLKSFALETEDQNMKQTFQQLADQQQQISDSLNNRLQYIQQEEPQYKQ